MSSADEFERIASVEEVREEGPAAVRVGGRTIGLFHHEGAFYATDNRCPHMGFPLTDGSVDDGILTCPWHHAHAAVSVYLDRFLNTPPAPLPDPDGGRHPDGALEDLVRTFDVETDAQVDRAGRATAEYLAAGGDAARLKRTLGEALLREDVGFHARQNLEAAFAQYDRAESDERARVHLVATARYLAAHTPTRRTGEQTFRIAERLARGETLHEG